MDCAPTAGRNDKCGGVFVGQGPRDGVCVSRRIVWDDVAFGACKEVSSTAQWIPAELHVGMTSAALASLYVRWFAERAMDSGLTACRNDKCGIGFAMCEMIR